MNNYVTLFWIVFLIPVSGFSATPITNGTYWQCSTQDNMSKEWIAKNSYQKVALNLAFSACKKESQAPLSCKTSVADCERFYQGLSTRPMWKCTALDRNAVSWISNDYPQRDDAALAAKAFCQQKSAVPETCYINLITCSNSIPAGN